ncbi:MAG: ZIP family metal transporter [Clostridia bacterium]|nr:ZIP family metal transporter [Clostridia bacterium]
MQWLYTLPVPVQALILSLFTWFMTALGGFFVFFSKRFSEKLMTFLTAVSAGIMIAASFFSLLLPALSYEAPIPIGVVVFLGFLIGGGMIPLVDLFLGRLFRGRETSSMLLVGSVTLHNIPEGMAIGVALGASGGYASFIAGFSLALGIGIQNFPEGLCVAMPLKAAGKSSGYSFFIAQLSGAVEIAACVLGAVFVSFSSALLPWVLSCAAGAMIAVVCSELIPTSFEKGKGLPTLGVIFGFALMMILDVLLS